MDSDQTKEKWHSVETGRVPSAEPHSPLPVESEGATLLALMCDSGHGVTPTREAHPNLAVRGFVRALLHRCDGLVG